MNDVQAIGCGVTGFGAAFFIIAVFRLFNRRFLITADVLLLIGINLMMHPRAFFAHLIQKAKLKGTIAFAAGIVLVCLRLAFVGAICELVGVYWLFGGFLPLFFSLVSKLPIIGFLIPSSLKKEDLDI
jgi:hypothetical protein